MLRRVLITIIALVASLVGLMLCNQGIIGLHEHRPLAADMYWTGFWLVMSAALMLAILPMLDAWERRLKRSETTRPRIQPPSSPSLN